MAHIIPDQPRPRRDFRMASPPPLCPHGVPYAQRCNGCGWVCPTCKRAYAPWVRECNYSHETGPRESTPPATPILPLATGEPATVNLRLPGDWARPGYQHLIRADGEWREATPGLQVLLGQPVGDGEEAIVHLRLTPEPPAFTAKGNDPGPIETG